MLPRCVAKLSDDFVVQRRLIRADGKKETSSRERPRSDEV